MIEIIAPLVSANEDNARIVEINKTNNQTCKKNDVVCILETSKASLEVEASDQGYIYNFYKVGDEVNAGDVIAIISENKIEKKDVDFYLNKTKDNTKKNDKVSITKKAQTIINSNKIDYKDIKSRGIIKEADVLSYLKKNSKNDIKDDDYIKLEKIMKLSPSEIKEVNFTDIKKLKETLLSIQNVYKKKWNRTVPSVEAIFDRWTTGNQYSNDEKTNISHLAYIIGNVIIGKNTYVGPFTFLDGGGSLAIGDNTSIAAGVQIYSHDNISRALSGHKLDTVYSKTEIGNNCFIGPNSVITRGVTIGDHCFIGGNSTVTFDVPPYTAVSGSPAEKIGKVKIESDGSVKISKERSY